MTSLGVRFFVGRSHGNPTMKAKFDNINNS